MHKQKVTIIGGGLGGLCSGAFLAKEGVDVTIIEKNSTIGGGLQSYSRDGAIFDTDMHVITGMHEGGSIYKLYKYLGILDEIDIQDNDKECSDRIYVAEDKKTYEIASGTENFIKSFSKYFPEHADEIRNYSKGLLNITNNMDFLYLRRPEHNFIENTEDFFIPVDEFIGKFISDKKLRNLLGYINLLYAGNKDITPSFLHAVISVLLQNGTFRLKGGSYRLAETMANFIRENGGNIILNDGATKIITEDNKIKEVITESGKSIATDKYISAIHPSAIYDMLDNKKAVSASYSKLINETPDSSSAFIINIKLKKDSFHYLSSNGYYFENYDSVWDDNSCGINKFMFLTPPTKDQGEFAETLCITVPMNWDKVEKWENTKIGNRGEEYNKWKEDTVEAVLAKIETIIPDIRQYIEFIDAASPLTIRDYTGVRHGAMCGYRKDSNNMLTLQLPIKTRITNLFLTGQNINIHGLCGVSLTAVQTCEEILGKNYILNKLNNEN